MLAPTLPKIQTDATPPSASIATRAQPTRPDAPKASRSAQTGEARARPSDAGRAQNDAPPSADDSSFAASLDRASRRPEPSPERHEPVSAPVEPSRQPPSEASVDAEPAESIDQATNAAPAPTPIADDDTDAPVSVLAARPLAPSEGSNPAPATVPETPIARRTETVPDRAPLPAGPPSDSAASTNADIASPSAIREGQITPAVSQNDPRAPVTTPGAITEEATGADHRLSAKPPQQAPVRSPSADAAPAATPEATESPEQPAATPGAPRADKPSLRATAAPVRDEPVRAETTDAGSDEPEPIDAERRPVAGETRAAPPARRESFEQATAPVVDIDDAETLPIIKSPSPAPKDAGEGAQAGPSVAQVQAAGAQRDAGAQGEQRREDARSAGRERAAPVSGVKDAPAQAQGTPVDARSTGEIRATPANPAQANATLTGGQGGAELDEAALASVHRGLTVALKQQGGSVQMRLTPESLGLLKIEMTIARGVVAATLQASTPEARELLGRSIETLRASLEAKGLSVERLSITLAPASQGGLSGQHSGTNTGAQQQQPGGPQTQSGDPNTDHDASGERSRGWFEREQKRHERQQTEAGREADERLFKFRFGLHAIG